jgi:FMN phosphatase YigB (HAD superfamily)
LIHRFASDEGYELVEPTLASALRQLKERQHGNVFDRLVVGIISNSDDRVPLVLSALGMRVSPLRHTASGQTLSGPLSSLAKACDIDFHCLSYDVGIEKPDPGIFLAAEQLCRCVVSGQPAGSPDADDVDMSADAWHKVLVGDDLEKDVGGVMQPELQERGWQAVYVGSDGSVLGPSHRSTQDHSTHDGGADVPQISATFDKAVEDSSLGDVFSKRGQAVTMSLAGFLSWMLRKS